MEISASKLFINFSKARFTSRFLASLRLLLKLLPIEKMIILKKDFYGL